eukprot:gene4143-8239_t
MTSILDYNDNFLLFHDSLASNGILSFFDKRLSTSTNICRLCGACACPCIFFGHITSTIARETRCWLIPKRSHINIGYRGACVCLCTGAMAMCMWPFSPFLGCFTCIQRRYLNIIYKDDFDHSFGWKEASKGLVWPCAVLQHYDFIERRREEGILRFDWEYDIMNDLLKPQPKRNDKLYFLLGPTNAGKTELFKKIIGVKSGATLQGRHDTKLRMGVRAIRASEDEMVFLELWDVAIDELSTAREELSKTTTLKGIVLIFDCTDPQSLEDMKIIYESLGTDLKDRIAFFCVSNKEDFLRNHDTKQTKIQGEEWAQNEGIPFFGISTVTSAGVHDLVKVLT